MLFGDKQLWLLLGSRLRRLVFQPLAGVSSGSDGGCWCRWLSPVGWVLGEQGEEGSLKGAGCLEGGSSPGCGRLSSGHTGRSVARPRIKCKSARRPAFDHKAITPLHKEGLFLSCLQVALISRFKKSSRLPARATEPGWDFLARWRSPFPGVGDSSEGRLEVCLVPLPSECPPPPSAFAIVFARGFGGPAGSPSPVPQPAPGEPSATPACHLMAAGR